MLTYSVLDGKTRLHVSLIIFRAYISITDRVIPNFLRNFFMQVNIIIYYLCNVLLVLDVLNALHCFFDSMYLRGEMKCPYPQTYKQNKLSPHAFKVNFFPVIAGNGKTQILVTFSATISFNLFPCWRKNWE